MKMHFRLLLCSLALPSVVACGGSGASTDPSGSSVAASAMRVEPSAPCPQSGAGAMNETWTLNGDPLTIPLPPNPPWMGTIAFPANSPTGTVVSETDDRQNFNYAPTSSPRDPRYGRRTKDLFMSFRVGQPTTFDGGGTPLLPIALTSTCLSTGTTYYIDEFAGDKFAYSESAIAENGSVTLHVEVRPNPFPAGVYVNAIVSH